MIVEELSRPSPPPAVSPRPDPVARRRIFVDCPCLGMIVRLAIWATRNNRR